MAQKIREFSGVCFQLFLPKIETVSHVKNPNFLEFGEGEEHQENNMLLGLLEVLESAGLTGVARSSFKNL